MQITIDTQRDSKEHLKYLVSMLMTFINDGQEVHTNVPNIFDDASPAPPQASALASLFEEKEVKLPKEEPKSGSQPRVELY